MGPINAAVTATLLPRAHGLTNTEFLLQWKNPGNVFNVLLIIGGDTVRTALAQLSGNSNIVPVCFSFGWVAFGFTNFMTLAGDGRLMPPPDYNCKVINAESGYCRENQSWMVGRLLRDNEQDLKEEALCITTWVAVGGKDSKAKAGHPWTRGWVWYTSVFVIIVQVVIAAIPWILSHDYGVFLVTLTGTALSLLTGSLPQWRAEKYACRTNESDKTFLITRGNGARHIMLIRGNKCSLDLEDLAVTEGPRSYRTWKNYHNIKQNAGTESKQHATKPASPGVGKKRQTTDLSAPLLHMPLGFHYTRIMCIVLAFFWILLMISASGLNSNPWYLLLVGGIGMLQNAFVAGYKQNLSACGIHLEQGKTIRANKVMHGLMDLEKESPKAGLCLLEEFFPGELHKDEEAWWDLARLNLAVIKYQKAIAKGRTPDAPDLEALYRKYGSKAAWEEASTAYEDKRKLAAGQQLSPRSSPLPSPPAQAYFGTGEKISAAVVSSAITGQSP